jgi:GntR family transcriptional regulator
MLKEQQLSSKRSQGTEAAPAALNPKSLLPLYHQLFEILHHELTTGKWKPGDLLPPESELVRRYGVSRITVRKVLELLAREGLIVRERGRGTYAAHPRLEHAMTRIVSFTDDMRQRGFEAGTKLLFSGLMPAPESIARALGIEEGTELARLDRLRLADGQPMCVEQSYLVHKYLPGILRHDFSTQSLREVKVREYGIRWSRARQTIQAILAPAELARVLGLKANSPLLYIERVSYSQDDVPVEFLRVYYRADRYILYHELSGGAG